MVRMEATRALVGDGLRWRAEIRRGIHGMTGSEMARCREFRFGQPWTGRAWHSWPDKAGQIRAGPGTAGHGLRDMAGFGEAFTADEEWIGLGRTV
jgi:hypothetical protein